MRSFDYSTGHQQYSTMKPQQVEVSQQKVAGKNPPPKLPFNRPKAVPSIPSNSVAPPEDKTITIMTGFGSG